MLSLFTPGLIKFELLQLNGTSWDVAVLLSLGPAAYIWRSIGFRFVFFSREFVIVIAILFAWYTVAGLRNAGDLQSWTIVAMFLRGLVVMFLIVLSGNMIRANGVVRTLFWAGVVMSIIAILRLEYRERQYCS